MIRGFKSFAREVFWRPLAGVWVLLTGFASVLSWSNVSEHWTDVTKILIGVVTPLLILLIYVLYEAYFLYVKVDRPLRVRKVSQWTHYFEKRVMVILERCGTVAIGDILILFVREGDAEIPICLISVEAITSKSFPQGVVLYWFTEEPLLDYLSDESRIEQLQAKRGVTRRHLECLITQ